MATSITGALQQEDNEEKNKVIGLEGKTNQQNTNAPHISGEKGNTQKRKEKREPFQKEACDTLWSPPTQSLNHRLSRTQDT